MIVNDKDYKWIYFLDDESVEEWIIETSVGDILKVGARDFIITEECRIFTRVEDYNCTINDYPLTILE